MAVVHDHCSAAWAPTTWKQLHDASKRTACHPGVPGSASCSFQGGFNPHQQNVQLQSWMSSIPASFQQVCIIPTPTQHTPVMCINLHQLCKLQPITQHEVKRPQRKRNAETYLDLHTAKHQRSCGQTSSLQVATSAALPFSPPQHHSIAHTQPTPNLHCRPAEPHHMPHPLSTSNLPLRQCPSSLAFPDVPDFFSPALTTRPPSVASAATTGPFSLQRSQWSQADVLTPLDLNAQLLSHGSGTVPPSQQFHHAVHPTHQHRSLPLQLLPYPQVHQSHPQHPSSVALPSRPHSAAESTCSSSGSASSLVCWRVSYASPPHTVTSTNPGIRASTSERHAPSILAMEAASTSSNVRMRRPAQLPLHPPQCLSSSSASRMSFRGPHQSRGHPWLCTSSPPPSWCSDMNSSAALEEANDYMTTLHLPAGVEFMRVGAGSSLHQLGVLAQVSAASICLAQSYYQRLVLVMPGLQLALYVLLYSGGTPKATLPEVRLGLPTGSAGPYSLDQAEAITSSVKAACVALAAKVVEPRTGHHRRLQWLLSRITSTSVTSAEASALEMRVLMYLEWRLGPYFEPTPLLC